MATEQLEPEGAATAAPEGGAEAEFDELGKDAPVYDERGNVRPLGTPGAIPMTYAERVAIAQALAEGKKPPLPKRRPAVPLPKKEKTDV